MVIAHLFLALLSPVDLPSFHSVVSYMDAREANGEEIHCDGAIVSEPVSRHGLPLHTSTWLIRLRPGHRPQKSPSAMAVRLCPFPYSIEGDAPDLAAIIRTCRGGFNAAETGPNQTLHARLGVDCSRLRAVLLLMATRGIEPKLVEEEVQASGWLCSLKRLVAFCAIEICRITCD